MVPPVCALGDAGCLLHRHRSGDGRNHAARQADLWLRRGLSHHDHPYLGWLPRRCGLRDPADEPVRAADRPVHPAARLWRNTKRQGTAGMTSQAQVALKNALRTGVILFVFALLGTAMLAFTHDQTEPTITRGRLAEKRALLSQVLPATLYDNDLVASQQTVPRDDLLGTRQPSALWVARRSGVFSGVVLEAVAPDGYSGDIALLIGIDAGGTVTGVRVTAHRETPGLGDYIDRAKSLWIGQFAGKSLTNPEPKHR